jgi:O-antigen/teichoic acid export membrane protein
MNKGSDHAKKFTVRFKTYFDSIRKRIVSRVSTDPILKGVLVISSGTTIAQISTIIFAPIITRLYPPAIYGTLAVFGSLLSILMVGGSLKYENTIPLPEKDDDALYLLILSFLIICTLSIILFIILTFWGSYFAGVFHFESILPYYWLLCIGFFGSSLFQIVLNWTLRSKDYIQITRTRITQGISGSVSKIIFGIFSFGSFGLICGDIIGRVVGIGTLGKPVLPKIKITINNLDFYKLRSLAIRYKKFPIFSLPSGFINEIALQAPTLILSTMFGFALVGLFSLSYSMLVLPVSLVSRSIGQVYYGEISELFRQKSDKILPLYLKTTKELFMVGAPLILFGAIVFPILFPLIFGSAWKEAGIFSLPLSIMVISNFVVGSTDRLELYGYNHWELAWNISRTLLVLLGFFLASQFKLSPVVTIMLYSLIVTIMYAICFILNVKAITLVSQKMRND